jgi:hypothetical protein
MLERKIFRTEKSMKMRFNLIPSQHSIVKNLPWKDATVIAGLSADISPSTYGADYIRINKDTVSKKYVAYQATDSTLTDYATRLNNYAGYVNFEFSPIKKLR